MDNSSRLVRIAGITLIGLALLVVALDVLMVDNLNLAQPVLFLALGGVLILLVSILDGQWKWSPLLYIPAMLLLALGLIFLLNVLTGDRNSWAYAWLLMLAGSGAGLAISARLLRWNTMLVTIGIASALGSLVLFAIFGAIAGGAFIQVITPVLLLLGGLALFWLKPAVLFSQHRSDLPVSSPYTGFETALVDPLSSRELEVLRLIEAGLTNQEIAQKLTVAQSTVKTHINNIYGKLGVQTRVQALIRARDLGLLR